MKRLLLGLSLLLAITSCQSTHIATLTGRHDFRPSAANEAKIGRVYSNVLRIGAIATPLPPGNWELISWRDSMASNNVPVHHTVFAKHDGEHLTELLTVKTSENSSAYGWQISRICQSSGWHHLDVISYASGTGGEGLCWGVAHSVWSQPFKGIFEKKQEDVVAWTKSRNLHPFNYGIARVYYVGRQNFISMTHIINPVALGYPDQPGLAWKGHPWSSDNVPAGTPADAFIQTQIREASIWWKAFRRTWF